MGDFVIMGTLGGACLAACVTLAVVVRAAGLSSDHLCLRCDHRPICSRLQEFEEARSCEGGSPKEILVERCGDFSSARAERFLWSSLAFTSISILLLAFAVINSPFADGLEFAEWGGVGILTSLFAFVGGTMAGIAAFRGEGFALRGTAAAILLADLALFPLGLVPGFFAFLATGGGAGH